MKINFLLILPFLLFSFAKDAPNHKGIGNVTVVKAYSQNVLGKNVGYYVVFKNNATSDVDALKWKALFYDNFDEYKGESEGSWSSGNFISPIKSGKTAEDLETAWIKDASKVVIKIQKVHFVNGKTIGKP
jgi:hypothetical protein